MRELDKRVALAAQRLIEGALLMVGAKSDALNAVTSLERPEDGVAGVHDVALWLAPGDALALRSGIAALRPKLRAGSRIVLAVRRRPPVLLQVRGMLGGPVPSPISLETLCGALLLNGLRAPRVHEAPRGWYLLSATLPEQSSALDVFFTQPAASERR
jgi:hypothetical protein